MRGLYSILLVLNMFGLGEMGDSAGVRGHSPANSKQQRRLGGFESE